jgi:hypothetical protein
MIRKAQLCDGGHFRTPGLTIEGEHDYDHCRGESPMTAVKKTGKRFARWFKAFREKNRPPYRYYEHSLYDA